MALTAERAASAPSASRAGLRSALSAAARGDHGQRHPDADGGEGELSRAKKPLCAAIATTLGSRGRRRPRPRPTRSVSLPRLRGGSRPAPCSLHFQPYVVGVEASQVVPGQPQLK